MNPLSLLTKGRTLRGFKDRSSAYRLTIRGVAPNFSAGRNISPTPPHPQPQGSLSTLFEKPPPPAISPGIAPAPQQPALAPHLPWGKSVWNRLAGFCRDFVQRWTAKRHATPFQAPTVQTELVLEKVTVKRNDLSEDDLEVVPVARKKKPAEHDQCQAISTDR
ncbi:MAG TPA: hypothetical protein VMR33_09635 [Candidatus Baltobacteraceae bacterium]|jgi:hypothetical protein|nr:hypothetical protein [Candidatus Baltobacteraceae bacterium]